MSEVPTEQPFILSLHARIVADVARLHTEGIPTGFISSLGLRFVTALYEVIAKDVGSFGL